MDYLFMVPFAGVTAFDRMARAAADMRPSEGWRTAVLGAQAGALTAGTRTRRVHVERGS